MKFEVSLFILVMKMESDISKITLALASCPGQPDARCARGNLPLQDEQKWLQRIIQWNLFERISSIMCRTKYSEIA